MTEISNLDLYQKNFGLSKDILLSLNQELKISKDLKLTKFARERRLEALKEALSWERGPDQNNRKVTKLYFFKEYTLAIAKPGKEAAPDYKNCRNYKTHEKTNNQNDMNPQILKDGKKIEENLTFEDMFNAIDKLKREDLFGLELFGTLIFRAAFMLDHKKNEEGKWRYEPPEKSVLLLESKIPFISKIPSRVFLHFLEILSLNEDVKIYTLGYSEFTQDYGRINTLLTFAHLIAVLLNKRSLAKFAGSFARPPSGMAPLPKTKIAFECFPLLSTEFSNQETLLMN